GIPLERGIPVFVKQEIDADYLQGDALPIIFEYGIEYPVAGYFGMFFAGVNSESVAPVAYE
ncbi:MAG: hypothetical protein RR701_18740, partial [Comamonas sp.]